MKSLDKIGLGGGCHWCTEAVFQYLKGVKKVEQGWIASEKENFAFAEAVIVHFNPKEIPLAVLVEVHLHTHKSTSNHSLRKKYRSGIYVFSETQSNDIMEILKVLQPIFKNKLITKIYSFKEFKASREQIQNYYKKNPEKPFCKTFINPKLRVLLKEYNQYVYTEKLPHLIDRNNEHET
ncbi:peptide-methionine (S)-S-oxide reductase [Aquimarina sediminis]|uniref:peptide-methionine (S)-S-oxide reductase n=1 Tax=Aquimarina sediminis TaxID=2070536 RepID=UPI000CA04759|nr:peptide-methionine (S)-S-oxide reductase [Aquimarina sediminis]